MPLIESPRFQPGDLAAWQTAAARDLVWADTPAYRERVEDAELRLYRWGRDKDFYAGTSWGKDSVALAHMLATYLPGKPLVWIREEPTKNPDCLRVRDEFLRRFPAVRYDEITVHCRIDADGVPHATGTLEAGFAEAARRHGENHISGIRRHEAAGREKHFGPAAARPTARWRPSSGGRARMCSPTWPSTTCRFIRCMRCQWAGSLTGASCGWRPCGGAAARAWDGGSGRTCTTPNTAAGPERRPNR